jgi:hypothetical protein
MTEISPSLEIPSGDTRLLPFTVIGEDGTAQSLVGATLEYRLEDDDTGTVASVSDSGIQIVNRSDADGTFEVELSASLTESLDPDRYREVLTITDDAGNVTQFVGQLYILTV